MIAAIVNVLQYGVHGVVAPTASSTVSTQTRAHRATRLRATAVPAEIDLPNELRRVGGVLWWSTTDCRVGWLALSTGRTHALAGHHCHVWPAPSGYRAALSSDQPGNGPSRGLIMVRPDGTEARVAHTPGLVTGDLAWSPDGAVVGACVTTPRGPVLDLLYSDGPQEIRGACQSAWTDAGYLVAAQPAPPRVLVARRTVLSPEQAGALLPQLPAGTRRVVSAVAASGDRIAVALIAFDGDRADPIASVIVVLSTERQIVFRAPLGLQVPTRVGLAPGGTAVWYQDAVSGTATLLRIADGRQLRSIGARRYTWSPDGRYLAATTAKGVLVSTWPDGRYVATIPVEAADLGWT